MSLLSRTKLRLIADFHFLAGCMTLSEKHHAEAHTLIASVVTELLFNAADKSIKTGREIDKTVSFRAFICTPSRFVDIEETIEPTMFYLKRKCWKNGVLVSFEHQDGGYNDTDYRSLTLSAKFSPLGPSA